MGCTNNQAKKTGANLVAPVFSLVQIKLDSHIPDIDALCAARKIQDVLNNSF